MEDVLSVLSVLSGLGTRPHNLQWTLYYGLNVPPDQTGDPRIQILAPGFSLVQHSRLDR